MKTSLKKRQKHTEIYFNEESPHVEIYTHNTNLKNRLTEYAEKYPEYCRQFDDDEQGGLRFEIEKGRFGFRLTAPYSDERRKKSSENAKQNGIHRR